MVVWKSPGSYPIKNQTMCMRCEEGNELEAIAAPSSAEDPTHSATIIHNTRDDGAPAVPNDNIDVNEAPSVRFVPYVHPLSREKTNGIRKVNYRSTVNGHRIVLTRIFPVANYHVMTFDYRSDIGVVDLSEMGEVAHSGFDLNT
ncbi:hypothetical protein PV327_011437 [Microctonus hyperodae]|uniref:Uncharacterized protein n=1 Tax=Microctonus hyperodae TaxID=165561 RepID=A0AA39KQ29_MICHY|nr:hypothetical protein PV327_011437 [Microctonus hyperodae]